MDDSARRMPRTLRSKRLRAALWYAAEGRCQRCRGALGDDWEADHIQPWIATGRTNVHEMQALCAPCNRAKGALMLRSHQAELERLCQDITAGQIPAPRFIGADIACGGGKQALAGIAAHYFVERARMFDKVCWIVPNGNLRRQALESLKQTEWLARYLGHGLELYENKNTPNPSKGRHGYVATYHAILGDPTLHIQEFERSRYLLILDEPHHCYLGREPGAFTRAVAPLVERAGLVLMMSGTLARDDRQPIAFLPYTQDGVVDKQDGPGWRWISYSRRQALLERAIIPTEFRLRDGEAQWRVLGMSERADSFGSNRTSLLVALKTEYALQLLEEGVQHWRSYRERHPRSKLVVICAGVADADRVLKHLRRIGVPDAMKATHEDDDADDMIKAFGQDGGPRALVTVQKTYEGLDVPAITHLICLTHIRSRPWIEQMLARAWRYDVKAGAWELQRAFVWAPADAGFLEIKQQIEVEQIDAARALGDPSGPEPPTGPGPGGPGGDDAPPVYPESSQATWGRVVGLGDTRSLDEDDTEIYAPIAQELGVSALELRDAYAQIERAKAAQAVGVRNGVVTVLDHPDKTPQERWDEARITLRETIHQLVHKRAGENKKLQIECLKTINTDLKVRYGERPSMTEEQFADAVEWVQRTYGY